MADLLQVRDAPPSHGSQSRLNLVGVVTGGAAQLALVWLTARLLSPQEAGTVFTALGVGPVAAAAPRSALGVAAVLLVHTLPAAVVLEPLLSLSRGVHDMRPTVVLDRAGRPVLQVALTVLAALSPSVGTVLAAWCLPYLLCAGLAYLATPALRPPSGPRPALTAGSPGRGRSEAQDPVSPARFRRYLASRAGTSMVQVAFARLDVVIVAALTGPREAAVYTVATRFVVLAQMVQQALATAAEPLLARAGHATRATTAEESVGELYRAATRWSVLLLWPVLCLLAVAPGSWLALFGGAYADAGQVVRVLAAAMALAVAVGPVETVLAMHGRAGVLVWTNLGALGVMVALDLALVPAHGASGAALGWAAAIVCKNLAGLWLVVRLTGDGPVEPAWSWALTVNLLAAGAAALALALASLQGAGATALAAPTAVVVGGLVVLGGYAALRERLGLPRPGAAGGVVHHVGGHR